MTKAITIIKELNKTFDVLVDAGDVRHGLCLLTRKLKAFKSALNYDYSLYVNRVVVYEITETQKHIDRVVAIIKKAKQTNPDYIESSGYAVTITIDTLEELSNELALNNGAPKNRIIYI